MTDPQLTHYAVLGVEPDADEATIRKAFNTAAKHLHPDRNNGVELPYYRLASEARDVLLDPARRAEYDTALANPAGPEPQEEEPPAEAWGEEEYVDATVTEDPPSQPAPMRTGPRLGELYPSSAPPGVGGPIPIKPFKPRPWAWSLLTFFFIVVAVVFLFWRYTGMPFNIWIRLGVPLLLAAITYLLGSPSRDARHAHRRYRQVMHVYESGEGRLMRVETAHSNGDMYTLVDSETWERAQVVYSLPAQPGDWVLFRGGAEVEWGDRISRQAWSTGLAVDEAYNGKK